MKNIYGHQILSIGQEPNVFGNICTALDREVCKMWPSSEHNF